MASRRGEGLTAHNVFLWPLKLVFYVWLTLPEHLDSKQMLPRAVTELVAPA